MNQMIVADALALVLARWEGSQDLSEHTILKMGELASGFVTRCERVNGIRLLDHVEQGHVESFIQARTASRGVAPAVATQHLRRSAVRLFFRTCRELGLVDADPTLDLALPPRSGLRTRRLTDHEVALCRAFANPTGRKGRQPVAWALAEGTATTSEIPRVTSADVELAGGRVWLHDGSRTLDRWGQFTDWGLRVVRGALGSDREAPLAYRHGRGSLAGPQASSCKAISKILRRAGLSEPDVRPASVRGWAGWQVYLRTRDLVEVGDALGVRSLDTAAHLIGLGPEGR